MGEEKMRNYPKFEYIQPCKESRYALLHYTGNGVVEDNFIEHGYIAENNNFYELRLLGDKLFMAFNTDAEIASTWTRDKFKVVELR